MVETLGEAWNLGWRLVARCIDGRVDQGRGSAKCDWSYELDMMTLVATRGRAFPLADMASRIKCPRCGCLRVRIIYVLPGQSVPQFGKMSNGMW